MQSTNSRQDRKRVGRAAMLALGVVVTALVLAEGTNVGAAEQIGPDNPRHEYWRRNPMGPGPELGTMDRRIREIADAFGSGRYGECRRLAQAVLEATDDADLRSQAGSFIIESHLAEGDFEGARAEAKRLNDEASLARIKKLKADYLAEVGRLQGIVVGATDVGEAAEAQLLTAHAHQRAGIVDLALESYWKVIDRYPQQTEAGQAVVQVGSLLMGRRDYGRALTHMKAVIRGYPKTRAAARSQLSIGNIHRVQGNTEKAEAAFLTAARSYRGDPVAKAARDTLAVMYYARGAEALARNDSLSALDSYRRGVHVDPNGTRKGHKTILVGDLCYTLERWEEARAAANEILKDPFPEFARLHETQREFVADTYYQQGLYSDALERYQSLLPDCQDPGRRDALEGMVAEIRERMRRSEEGEEEVR